MSDANNNNSSTLGSYANSTAAAIQSGISSLTGNTSDKVCLQVHGHQPKVLPTSPLDITNSNPGRGSAD